MKRLYHLIVVASMVLAGLAFSGPGLTWASGSLVNPGLNNPATYVDTGRDWHTYDEKVAQGWWYYYVADGTYEPGDGAPRLHWMSSQQFAQAFGGLDYKREGDAAQVIWSSYDFDAGIYQQVAGLTIGQDYAFEMALASYWRGSGYPITNGKMKKCIGVDPYGGTDPTASTVIWDWDNCDSTDKTWPYLDMAATAQASTMTFFIRIQSPENDSYEHTDLNYVFIDDGRFAPAPTVSLNVPTTSDDTINLQWAASPAPGWTLQGVEVRYKDQQDQVWHTIQGKTDTDTNYLLQGQPGHIYTIGARAWQTDGYEDLHGLWVEKQVQVGGVFAGYVRNNFGVGIEGAQVSATSAVTNSGPGGFYALQPQNYGQVYTLTASASGYLSPLYITGSVADALSVTPITFTLKPVNDAITNGDFETGTSGWNSTGPGSESTFSEGRRSGMRSLKLIGEKTLTQTVPVSDMYNPTLSFWYSPNLSGGAGFQVSLAGGGQVVSRAFFDGASTGWQHAWLPLGYSGQYDGSLTVAFHLSGGEIWLDEASLGNGPHTIFLPIVRGSAGP